MQPYPASIEAQMQRYYQSLREKDRRRYAAMNYPVRLRRGISIKREQVDHLCVTGDSHCPGF